MWELLAAVILIVATPLALVMADFGGMSGILIRNATFPRPSPQGTRPFSATCARERLIQDRGEAPAVKPGSPGIGRHALGCRARRRLAAVGMGVGVVL
jgi:hypothetical protein